MKKFCKDQRGDVAVSLVFFILGLIMLGLIVTEVLQIHSVQEHLNDELYRAANLGIKTAMYDSWRYDHMSQFDDDTAISAFKAYLTDDLGLNASNEKIVNGSLKYRLKITDIKVNGRTTRMYVKATAYVTPILKLWGVSWEIPIEVTSRNMRTD